MLWPLLCSSGQSSWLQIQRSGSDSRHYQIFWVVGLERGPLSLESTIEELLGRKSNSSGLENRITAVRDLPHYVTPLYPQKLALTLPTRGCHLVGILRSRTQATELLLLLYSYYRSVILFYFFCFRKAYFVVCSGYIIQLYNYMSCTGKQFMKHHKQI
jgi:hypothetical protein